MTSSSLAIMGTNTIFQTTMHLSLSANLHGREWLENYRRSPNSNFGFTPPHLADYYETNAPVRRVVSSVLPVTVLGRAVGFLQGDIDYEKLRAVLDTIYRQNEIEITLVTVDGVIVFDQDDIALVRNWIRRFSVSFRERMEGLSTSSKAIAV